MSTAAAAVNTERQRREAASRKPKATKASRRSQHMDGGARSRSSTSPTVGGPASLLRRQLTRRVQPTPAAPPPAVSVPSESEEDRRDFSTPSGAVGALPDTVIYAAETQGVRRPNGAPLTRMESICRWWVIDPRTNHWLGSWDITTMVALLFVAIVTPFEIAFLEAPRNAGDILNRMYLVGWLFIVNRLVDGIFVVDMVLQFRLMYASSNAVEGTRWHSDPVDIFKHYVYGWFWLDFLSIAVSAFDILPLFNQDADDVRDLRVLRVMRVLRLIKLVRLLRASRLFQRWETKIAINYSRLGLVKSLVYVVLLSHWFACIWGLQVALGEKEGSWVEFFEYCTYVGNASEALDGYDCPGGSWSLYSASVYWSVMTITSIGYGDIHATDRKVSEQVLNTFCMLSGGMLWGHVIGTFCGVVATMNPQSTEFNRRMDDLNRYMTLHNLPDELRRRLREYMHQTKHLQIAAASKEIITLLSPALQGEVVWMVHKPWLSRVPFFHGAEPEFLVQISLSLSPLVFTPGELAINGFLYIVHRGIALFGGRVLTSGKVRGARGSARGAAWRSPNSLLRTRAPSARPLAPTRAHARALPCTRAGRCGARTASSRTRACSASGARAR